MVNSGNVVRVTRAQVEAAKLRKEILESTDSPVDEKTRRIAAVELPERGGSEVARIANFADSTRPTLALIVHDDEGSFAAEDGTPAVPRHTIKGAADSMIFHALAEVAYRQSEVEVWFTDEAAAKKAGFKHWDHRKND